jgi:hypothetical protein
VSNLVLEANANHCFFLKNKTLFRDLDLLRLVYLTKHEREMKKIHSISTKPIAKGGISVA